MKAIYKIIFCILSATTALIVSADEVSLPTYITDEYTYITDENIHKFFLNEIATPISPSILLGLFVLLLILVFAAIREKIEFMKNKKSSTGETAAENPEWKKNYYKKAIGYWVLGFVIFYLVVFTIRFCRVLTVRKTVSLPNNEYKIPNKYEMPPCHSGDHKWGTPEESPNSSKITKKCSVCGLKEVSYPYRGPAGLRSSEYRSNEMHF